MSKKVLVMTADEKAKCVEHYAKMIKWVENTSRFIVSRHAMFEDIVSRHAMFEDIGCDWFIKSCALCANHCTEDEVCITCPLSLIGDNCSIDDSSWGRLEKAHYKGAWLREARAMLKMFEHAEVSE